MSAYAQNATEVYGGGVVANATSEVRMAFIRKVYLCFSAMLLMAMAGTALSIKTGLAYTINQIGIMAWLGIIVFGFVVFAVRKVPVINIVAMLAMGAAVGVYMSDLILYSIKVAELNGQGALNSALGQSFILTTTIFVGLTSYVFITRSDFSWMGGMLWMGFLILIGAFLCMYFFGSGTGMMYTIFLAFGVFLFSAYILYDTSVIIHHLAEDEYVMGAMNLFFDFINLFLMLLQLFLQDD